MLPGYQRYHQINRGTVRDDPLYRAALAASHGRSVVLHDKLQNLFLLIRDELGKLPSQDIVEMGSYKGGSALFMGYLLREFYPTARFYSLDTFQGMPQTDPSKDLHRAGDFADCDFSGFSRLAGQMGNIVIVPGLIEDTLVKVPGPVGLAHIDVDIYGAVKFGQENVWPKLTTGGFLVYDDTEYPTCLGATHAAEEFKADHRLLSEQVWPHWVVKKP